MTRIIPARIEGGQVVPESPLPPEADVLGVSIVVETVEPERTTEPGPSLSSLFGILQGVDTGDPKEEYIRYLEEKYR